MAKKSQRIKTAYPIDWHKNCCKNESEYLDLQKAELARMQADVERQERRVNFYKLQIDEAERTGRKEFDPDRFMKSQRPE